MPDSAPPPLAQQARSGRWWFRALRRSPVLSLLIVAELAIAPTIWSLWGPPQWVRWLVTVIVLGPVNVVVGGIRQRVARSLESADELAERTGRRRPVSAGVGLDHRLAFTWNSRTGRRLIIVVLFWIASTVFGVVVIAKLWHDDPPHSVGDLALIALVALLLPVCPLFMLAITLGGELRTVRRTMADPAERAFVTVIGIDPGTRQWVFERMDDEHRFSARVFGGRRLLVAGDELLATGILSESHRSRRRPFARLFALTGPFGTVFANHGDLSEVLRYGTPTGTETADASAAVDPATGFPAVLAPARSA